LYTFRIQSKRNVFLEKCELDFEQLANEREYSVDNESLRVSRVLLRFFGAIHNVSPLQLFVAKEELNLMFKNGGLFWV